ncbi:MAG TPA: tetratricopeptide repeat protein, partial [Acidobacteriota bacterium]|nr:tetratricopeptide repeat protein [Acidobacteriota bacterium]
STRLLTMGYGFVKMIQLLAWPAHLAADYDFSQIPLTHMLTLKAGLSLALVGGLLVAGVILFQYEKITSFAIFFFFGTTLLVSNLIFPIGILIAERTLYFPSISICLIAGAILAESIRREGMWRLVAGCLCGVLIIGGIVRTMIRNLDWRDSMEFGTAMIRDAPSNPKGYLVMGLYYLSQHRNAEAEVVLKKGIPLDLTRASLRNVLVDIYLREDRLEEAQAEITEIFKINPHSPHGKRNLARLLVRQHKDQAAVAAYRETMTMVPILAENHHEFAVLLSKTGDLKGAETEFLRAIELRPTFVEAYLNLGLTYRSLGKLDQAILCLKETIRLSPKNDTAYALIGQIWLRQSRLDEAIHAFQQALALNPKCIDCYNNLGVALAQNGQQTEAEQAFQQAIILNPNDSSAVQNLERLRQQLKP